ncbi:MAG TPA: sporulation peptidase YabG [Clostridiales bacterium]|nr:sporulation peptidase YabG [Clostridiales bacterium]
MYDFKVGDIVARKSYGGDIYFRIADIIEKSGGKQTYILKGLFYRIEADSNGDDLVKQDTGVAYRSIEKDIYTARNNMYRNASTMNRARIFPFLRLSTEPGRILHIDADESFLNMCLRHYKEYRIPAVGKLAKESEQPGVVRKYLETYRPNVLVLTGHDSFKKNSDKNNIGSYSNSKYFIESARIARKYESNPDRLCIFSGACQSYYEQIMDAGANFASSPGRILINALDPAFVAQKISLTDSRTAVTPDKAVALTISGSKGIWGINTKGQLKARYAFM